MPFGQLVVVTGANGTGKSNLYKALRLLADCARGGIVASLAREGGLSSVLWAGPESHSRKVKSGEHPVQGTGRRDPISLRLGFCAESIGYCIDIGLPIPLDDSLFNRDPEIKRECIFAAPVFRQPAVATRTTVMAADGRDLAAALQTIREIGNGPRLDAAIHDAFPGASVNIGSGDVGLRLEFMQPGLLRPLSAAELSDGTLRYLLWIAALLTPRPPPLMVLNEPETSLHPDLLPALGRLISQAAKTSQVWVVSHANRLVATLKEDAACNSVHMDKSLGESTVRDQGILERPAWEWPPRN